MQRGKGERERDTVEESTVSITHHKLLLASPVTYPHQRTHCAPCQVASKIKKKDIMQNGSTAITVEHKRET